MQRDIVQKLQAELSKPIETECQVVYILVEIRKFLEQIGQSVWEKKYRSLKLHCDWAVHSLLDRGLARELIARLDDLWQEPESCNLPDKEFRELSGVLAFDNFRRELNQFLQEQDLPVSICDSDSEWLRFIHLYSSVVQDSPLKCEGNDIPLQHFDKVIISKEGDKGFLWELYYQGRMRWRLALTEDCKLLGAKLST